MVNTNLYNEDELHPPEWLNKQFFEKVLKNVEKEKVKITELVITPGTTKSDHYASVMFRAKLKYLVAQDERTRSFVLKTSPSQDSYKKEKLKHMTLFETEIKMYTEALPRIEAILRRYGDDTKLCPNIVYHNIDGHKCIIFEDLVEEGYTTINNRDITLQEVKLALSKLAKLHAVSYKMAKDGDKIIPTFNKGSFNSLDWNNVALFRDAVKLFKEIVVAHADLQCYLPHIKAVESDFQSKCIATFDAYSSGERDGIFVLNHGDFHIKNMMIKQVDGQLRDLMLLDYQLCIYGTPAIDLHYAFIMLFSPGMRRNHYDELLYHYIINFQETLKMVKFRGSIPTVLEFRNELQKHKHWGLYLLMAFLTFNYILRDEKGDIAKYVEDEEYRRTILQNPKLLDEVRQLLPRFLHLGYFGN